MIINISCYKECYYIYQKTSIEEIQETLDNIDNVKCIICNRYTAENFIQPNTKDIAITINNSIKNRYFFINNIR